MQLPALLLVAAFLPSQAAGPAAPATALLPDCLVTLIEEAHVPAQEPGVLKKIPVRQGQAVEAGELLAQVDETKILADLRVAQAKLKAAQEKAGDDINVRYAKAASLTARAEYNFNLEA
ncbi:MAG: biotin/lipoyl-binding protein, partial [Candidatus Aminicenantales bacterium]